MSARRVNGARQSVVAWSQWLLYGIFHLPLTLLLRPQLRGLDSWTWIANRPVLIAANHVSYADPFLLFLLPFRTARQLIPMALPTAERMYRRWWLLIAPLGAYPIPPYGWSFEEYLGHTRDMLRNGFAVLLFLEGRLNVTNERPQRSKPGIAYLAQETGARVYPLRIRFQGRAKENAGRVRTPLLSFGRPLEIGLLLQSTTAAYQAAADRILQHVYELD